MAEHRESQQPVPEGFTLALALVDAVPVLAFCLATIAFGVRLGSGLFLAGAVLATIGGAGKVSWRLVIALAHKNIPLLSRQMRITMPLGFAVMVAGLVLAGPATATAATGLVRLPSLALLIAWILCMCTMGYLAGHRDQSSARDNWHEQLVNATGQLCLLAAVLLA